MEPALGHHRVEVQKFDPCYFANLGHQNKINGFPNFPSYFFVCKTAPSNSENFQKSAQSEPTVGYDRIEALTDGDHRIAISLHIWACMVSCFLLLLRKGVEK